MFIMRDKRIKGCWNPKCKNHKKHFKYHADDLYCSKCRSELVYICAKCGNLLEDEGRKHRICNTCIQRQKANSENRKQAFINILYAIAGVGNLIAEKINTRK